MMESSGAAHAGRRRSAQLSGSAASVFQHLGDVSQQLMELQAQAAAVVLMDSTARCVEVTEGMLRHFGMPGWMQIGRSQMRGAMGPLEAWFEATAGLQAVVGAAFLQALALTIFPDPSRRESARLPERRVDSVVIPFPDRRRDIAS